MALLTLVYKCDAVHVYWHEQHQYYLADWQGVFRKGDELRAAYLKCVELARTRRGAPWLTDASKFTAIDPADTTWISEVFWPEFIKAGAKYQAAISPKKEIAKLSANRATENLAQSGFQTTVHATRAEAEAAIAEWRAKHERG